MSNFCPGCGQVNLEFIRSYIKSGEAFKVYECKSCGNEVHWSNDLMDVSDIPTDGPQGITSPNSGPIGEERQAVMEIEQEEQIASLRNEISILQRIHGEAVAGWSNYQRLYENSQKALMNIRALNSAAEHCSLTHAEKRGISKVIGYWADCQLPHEVGEIPF